MIEPKIVITRTYEGYVGRIVEGSDESFIHKGNQIIFKSVEAAMIAAATMRPNQHFWIGDATIIDARTKTGTLERAVRWTLVMLLFFYSLIGTIFHWWPFK